MEPQKVDVTILDNKFQMEFDLDNPGHRLIYGELVVRGKPYEEELTAAVCRILRPRDTFIDVGAHIGWFTLIASQIVGPHGRVIAIEPDIQNQEWLERQIDINNINGNTERRRMAITAKSGMVPFYLNADNDGGHALWPVASHPFNQKTADNQQMVMVEGVTLDDLCQQEGISEIKLIKIDTEGAEVDVLRGASELLVNHKIKHIIAEVNDFGFKQMKTNVNEMVELMNGFGYTAVVLGYRGPEFVYNLIFSVKG